jgi:hypothetical protein
MEGLQILLQDLLDRVKSNTEKNMEQTQAIKELQEDVKKIKEKINDDTIYKAKMYDNAQNIFSKRMFWIAFAVFIALVGFGISGVFSNADNIVKITKSIKQVKEN